MSPQDDYKNFLNEKSQKESASERKRDSTKKILKIALAAVIAALAGTIIFVAYLNFSDEKVGAFDITGENFGKVKNHKLTAGDSNSKEISNRELANDFRNQSKLFSTEFLNVYYAKSQRITRYDLEIYEKSIEAFRQYLYYSTIPAESNAEFQRMLANQKTYAAAVLPNASAANAKLKVEIFSEAAENQAAAKDFTGTVLAKISAIFDEKNYKIHKNVVVDCLIDPAGTLVQPKMNNQPTWISESVLSVLSGTPFSGGNAGEFQATIVISKAAE